LNRLRGIIKKEIIEIMRDKRTLGLLIFFPSFLLFLFGFALNYDIKNIDFAVLDYDNSAISRQLIEKFSATDFFNFKYKLYSTNSIDKLIAEEKIKLAIIVPYNFSENIKTGKPYSIEFLIDASNPLVGSVTSGYIMRILNLFSFDNKVVPHFLTLQEKTLYNPEMDSTKFLMPGLIGYILMIVTVIATSMSLVKEVEKYTMEQLKISKLHPLEIIIGKLIPYFVISLLTSFLILITGKVFFEINVEGSWLLLTLVIMLFAICGLSMGLFISTIAETQLIAFIIAIMMSVLPTFLLSGFVFPIENMPKLIQYVTYFIPAKYFINMLRIIILKGKGVPYFYKDFVILSLMTLGIILVSAKRLKQKLGF